MLFKKTNNSKHAKNSKKPCKNREFIHCPHGKTAPTQEILLSVAIKIDFKKKIIRYTGKPLNSPI